MTAEKKSRIIIASIWIILISIALLIASDMKTNQGIRC